MQIANRHMLSRYIAVNICLKLRLDTLSCKCLLGKGFLNLSVKELNLLLLKSQTVPCSKHILSWLYKPIS